MQKTKLCFIGDIHGQADKLETLLNNFNEDSDIKLVFIGDLIDPAKGVQAQHLPLLERVKSLVDNQQAYCLMGNHEFNAVGWCLQKEDGEYCRSRTKPSNRAQHQDFINEVEEDSALHQQWIAWFKTLPLFLEFDDIKTIHACWHQPSIEKLRLYLNADNTLKEKHWLDAFDKKHELYDLVGVLLKGAELDLPAGYSYQDKTGTTRHKIRVAWWKAPETVKTYQDLAVIAKAQQQNIPAYPVNNNAFRYYQVHEKPVVIGHYTLDASDEYQKLADKVICVDFNAAKKENPLVGYVFDSLYPERSGYVNVLGV